MMRPFLPETPYARSPIAGAPWHRTVYCTLALPFVRCEHRRNDVEHGLSCGGPDCYRGRRLDGIVVIQHCDI